MEDPTGSADPAEVPSCVERIGILRCGGWRLGVIGRYCSGLLQISSPTRLPRSPAHILGVAHLRGKIVPIFDLSAPLGIGRAAGVDESPEVGLVVRADGKTCVLAADEVVAFEDVDLQPLREIETGTPARLRRFGRGQLRHLGHDVFILRIPALLEAMRFRCGSGSDVGFEEAQPM